MVDREEVTMLSKEMSTGKMREAGAGRNKKVIKQSKEVQTEKSEEVEKEVREDDIFDTILTGSVVAEPGAGP